LALLPDVKRGRRTATNIPAEKYSLGSFSRPQTIRCWLQPNIDEAVTIMAAIHDALAALHGDEKYADLTVTCGDHIFKLHRAVICPQSPFFEKACSGGFMVGLTIFACCL
jgi:hypothetical protein